MLPPRPIGREPEPPPLPRPDEGRLWEMQERVTRLEADRRWLGAALLVMVLGAGLIGPVAAAWIIGRWANRQEGEVTRLDGQIRALDRDVGELLAAVLELAEERAADPRIALAPPPRAETPPPAPARVRAAPPPAPATRRPPAAPSPRTATTVPSARKPTAADWAETFSAPILDGSLDERERAALRDQWERLDPVLQDETLTVLLRRYGLDPERFLMELEEPYEPLR